MTSSEKGSVQCLANVPAIFFFFPEKKKEIESLEQSGIITIF